MIAPPALPRSAFRLSIADREYDLARRVLVVGIVNVTPDSFSDGGRFLEPSAAVERGLTLVAEGADLLDVGGESTRPGARPVPADEEQRRTAPVVRELVARSGVPVSVDTYKPEVARAALDLGARVLNDVTGLRLRDADGASTLARLAAAAGASVVAMHMRGEPSNMQADPHYDDCVAEVTAWLAEAARAARAAGLGEGRLVLDPGIGFGKTLEHNLALLRGVDRIAALGHPVAIGVSRKSLFERLLGLPLDERLEAGLAAAAAAIFRGARLVRTHDVRATVRFARTLEAILPDSIPTEDTR